nr:hypothetical protein [Tanacetum cinerariifolium]
MANLSEDIQCAGSDTRPPMLDRTDFASWQQRIRLYCRGKDNEQHDAHAKENKMVLERLSQPIAQPIAQPTADPLALLSNVSNTQHGLPSSSTSSITPLTPPRANSTDDLIENLTSTLALLTQSNRTFLPQTNNQLRTSSNPRNQATDMGRLRIELGMLIRVKRDQAQENGVALDAEQLLFLAGGPDNAFDKDVDEQPVQDLALNADNVFQAEDCDAFDSDVDEAPTAQTMFMANLSSADPITDEAGPSYDSDILSEVRDHDQYLDDTCTYQEEHVIHDSVQLVHVVDLHADHTSSSNMIPYDQYVKDIDVSVVHSNASSVPNDTFMMIYDDMCEPIAPSVSNSSRNAIVKNFLTAELATYREQVELPRPLYNDLNKVAIGYKNPLCLTHEILKDNHARAKVHNTEDTLKIAEITRKKMNAKMIDPECVTHKVKIAPHDYSKENLLATFTP